MSNASKALRGLLVVIIIAIMAFIIWRFTAGLYLIPSIIIAALITAGVVFLFFRPSKAGTARFKEMQISNNSQSTAGGKLLSTDSDNASETIDPDSDRISIDSDATDIPPRTRGRREHLDKSLRSVKPLEVKPDGTEVAARYIRMSKTSEGNAGVSSPLPARAPVSHPPSPAPAANSSNSEPEAADSAVLNVKVEVSEPPGTTISPEPEDGGSPMPLIEENSSLTEDENNELVNAVWCRCENPYCKYTRFLSVHHLVEEKDGGTNKLDNLVVLCPYCHDLAHRNEIPDKEMRDWISNREERFKFKPNWHYF